MDEEIDKGLVGVIVKGWIHELLIDLLRGGGGGNIINLDIGQLHPTYKEVVLELSTKIHLIKLD